MKKNSTSVAPPVGSGDLPQLFRLPGLRFQALCRDIFDAEPNVKQCVEFGTNGQAQYGIDLIGYLETDGIAVGQCKAEQDFTPAKIRKASDEFFKHWNYWEDKNVKRFVIFVGSEVSQTQRQEEVLKQRQRFGESGISYELWPASKMVNKLRPHRGVVTQHLDSGWANLICGGTIESSTSVLLAGQTALNEHLTVAFAIAIDERVARMKQAWQTGRRTEARQLLARAKDNQALWVTLPAPVRANILRFEASISMDSGDWTAGVSELLEEAARLNPCGDDLRLKAAMLWHTGKRHEAIEILDDTDDESAVDVKALMFLVTCRHDEAESLLASHTGSQITAEHLRIEALCHMARHRLAEARLAIQKAAEKEPFWLNISLTAGAIEYFSALSESKLPLFIPHWPEPVHWDFVLRNDEAQGRLHSAAARFKEALDLSDVFGDERQVLETWYIACLANMPNSVDSAKSELVRLLDARPVNHRLIVWATARFPDLEIESSIQVLRASIIDGSASAEQVAALVHRYAVKRQWRKAWALLVRTKTLFSEGGGVSIWSLWAAQIKVFMGAPQEAEAIVREGHLCEVEWRLVKARTLGLNKSTSGLEDLIEHLEASYTATKDPQFLLESVETKAQSGDWVYVAKRAQALFSAIQSAEVLQLCAFGAYKAHDFRLCLTLLESNLSAFPGSKLPAAMGRIRIQCHHELGSTSIAIQEASSLAGEEPSAENLFSLSQLHFSTGDYRQLAVAAEKLVTSEMLSAASFLRLSWQTQWEDQSLARRLWERAVAISLSDEDIIPAVTLGYALGLDEEMKSLLARMTQLGAEGKSGIQLASLDDIKGFAFEFQKRAQEFGAAYDRGQVPIHMIATALNLTLGQIYHQQLTDSTSAPFASSAPCVWARHARRALPEFQPGNPPAWRLTLDVTSLLLAEHFGFLDHVEVAFAPLRISPGLIPSLVLMQDRLTANQPQRDSAYSAIVQLVDAGLLAVVEDRPPGEMHRRVGVTTEWIALAEDAATSNGFVVDFIPLIKEDGQSLQLDQLPPELRKIVIGQKAILCALFEHGPLSQEQFDSFSERLGSIQLEPVDTIPQPGTPLFFAGTSIETLAGVGLLPEIAARFRVHLTRGELDRLKAELQEARHREDLADWIKSFIKRLSNGIGSGVYQLLPNCVPTGQELNIDPKDTNADIEALRTVLQADSTDRDRFCADDRWLNGHERAGAMAIIDSVSVLAALVDHGRITRGEYFALLGRMRAEGVHFIPLSAEEITSQLRVARVGSNGVVETSGLKNLRRGIAASLVHARVLQRDQIAPGSADFGELSFLVQHVRVCAEALCIVWTDAGLNPKERAEKANWIITSLYVDQHAVRQLAQLPVGAGDDRYALAVTFASLLARALTICGVRDKDSVGRDFIDWVFVRLIERRAHFQPGLLDSVADYVKSLFTDLAPKSLDTKASQAMLAVIQRVVRDLPRALRDKVAADSDFMAAVGLKTIPVADVGSLRFEKTDYLAAVVEAVNGRFGEAKILGTGTQALFSASEPPGSGIRIRVPSTGEIVDVTDSLLGLLSESAEGRETAAFGLSRILDLPTLELRSTIAELASAEDIDIRIRGAEDLRDHSLTAFYDDLQRKVAAAGGISERDLFPRFPESLLGHLRIVARSDSAVSLAETISDGAIDNLSQLPLEEVLSRLFRLPSPLPERVSEKLVALSPPERYQLTKRLLKLPKTPLSRIHLARVFLQLFGAEERYSRLGKLFIRSLISNFPGFSSYLAFIRWSLNRVANCDAAPQWRAGAQLAAAWAHGDRIFGIVRAGNFDVQEVSNYLALTSARLQGLFAPPHCSADDVANPNNIDPEVLLLCGLAHACGNYAGIDPKVGEVVRESILVKSGDNYLPALGLLPSTSTAANEIGSIFAGDRISLLESWIAPETYASIREALSNGPQEQTIDALKLGRCEMWMSASAVLGQFPLRRELIPSVENAILASNFGLAAQENPKFGSATLLIATSIYRFVPEGPATQHLEAQIVAVARALNLSARDPQTRALAFVLLESVLNLVRRKQDMATGISEFSRIMAELAAVWPLLGEEIRPFIQRLCEELPVEQTAELWRLNCRLRTRR